MTMGDFSWVSCATTHVGKVRKINQDAYLELPEQGLWLVADGMGGHDAGELASASIVDALQDYTPEQWLGASVVKIYRRLAAVNYRLIEMANKNGHDSVIGSTVALLLVYHQQAVCLWSGDSRIYLFRKGKLWQLTRDHNYASELLAKGHHSDVPVNSSFGQALTHAVGATQEVYLETQIQEVRHGDIYLLCSDGLNKEVNDTEIEAILGASAPDQAVSELMDRALTRGARDNVTIIVAGC